MSKVVYQKHHIRYGNEEMPEWIVSVRRWMHMSITRLQQMKPSDENYAELINYQHAITSIVNDMRMRLDTQGE